MNRAAPDVEERISKQRIFSSEVLEIGLFEAHPDDPDFRFSGPPGRFQVVFPRTSVSIEHEGRPSFVTDLNTVTFYNPADIYFRRPIDPVGDSSIWLAPAVDVVDELVGELGSRGAKPCGDRLLPFCFGPLQTENMLLERAMVASLQEGSNGDRLAVEETGLLLFSRAVEDALKSRRRLEQRSVAWGTRARDFRRGVLRKTLETLGRSLEINLSLAEISREAGCSPFHLCRIFREEMGQSLHQYRLDLRIRRALDLILRTKFSLSDIASEVGFASHSHLTAMFKRAIGTLPSEWRRSERSLRQRH